MINRKELPNQSTNNEYIALKAIVTRGSESMTLYNYREDKPLNNSNSETFVKPNGHDCNANALFPCR